MQEIISVQVPKKSILALERYEGTKKLPQCLKVCNQITNMALTKLIASCFIRSVKALE